MKSFPMSMVNTTILIPKYFCYKYKSREEAKLPPSLTLSLFCYEK